MSISSLAAKLKNKVAAIDYTSRGESEARATLQPHTQQNAQPNAQLHTQPQTDAHTDALPHMNAQAQAAQAAQVQPTQAQGGELMSALRVDASKQKTSSASRMAAVFLARKSELAKTNPSQLTAIAREVANAEAAAKVENVNAETDNTITFNGIVFNEQQSDAIRLSRNGESFVLVGSAGTGKTTTVQAIVYEMMQQFKPSQIALVAYTNRAVRNIRKACKNLPEQWSKQATSRCFTIHKFLAYRPVPYSYVTENNELRESKRFEPTYHQNNQLPDIRLVVIDESSMVQIELFRDLYQSCPNAIFVYIGDLNQLLPVFGDPILAYKLMEHKVIELEQVYRQAMDSPIVKFQYEYTLVGIPPSDSKLKQISESQDALKFVPFTGQYKDNFGKMQDLSDRDVAYAIAQYMKAQYEAGKYAPETDVLLCPYGDAICGAKEMSRWIAQWLGEKRNAKVHEIIAGFEKRYYAVGDYVLHNKEEYVITAINENPKYGGAEYKPATHNLMRNGFYSEDWHLLGEDVADAEDATKLSFDELIDMSNEDKDTRRVSSHIIELHPLAAFVQEEFRENEVILVDTAGDVSKMEFAYATTVYKAQGSEWRKVFLAFLRNHKAMLSREQLYTAMTRAREELTVIYSPARALSSRPDNTIARCITNPEVPGKGWRVKVKKFEPKVQEYKAKMAKPCEWS